MFVSMFKQQAASFFLTLARDKEQSPSLGESLAGSVVAIRDASFPVSPLWNEDQR